MTDEFEDEQDEAQGSKKKGRAEGAGSIGRGKGTPSTAFYEVMARFGATMDQIARILREWSYLPPDALNQRLKEFSKETARASAHAQVEFDKKRDFSILHNFLALFRRESRGINPRLQHEDKPGPK